MVIVLKKWGGPALAVAMVWFTTHFGGGFASGRQIVEFYVQFGWYAVFFPLVAQAITALIFYYLLCFTIVYKTYDYASWAHKFYHPYDKVLAPIYEIRYLAGMFIVTAVVFATAAATLAKLSGLPYVPCAVISAATVFLLTIYGSEVVRSAANAFAAVIVVGLLILYGSNIIANLDGIAGVLAARPAPHGFWLPFWEAVSYASYQAGVGTWCAVAEVIKTKEEAKRAAILGFLANGVLLQLATLGILGHYPQILKEVVPTLYMVEHGVGGNLGKLLVSLLIIIGALSTAVNVVYGATKRLVLILTKGKATDRKSNMFASALYVAISWGLALFGLIPLVSKGYNLMGYTTIPLVVMPFLYWGIRHSNRSLSLNDRQLDVVVKGQPSTRC